METVTWGVAVHRGRRPLLAVRAYRPIRVSDEPETSVQPERLEEQLNRAVSVYRPVSRAACSTQFANFVWSHLYTVYPCSLIHDRADEL